jgi:phytoene synthase
MIGDLTASYAHCRDVARRAAGSFYYSVLVLPHAKRQAMCALYAFRRATDDLGDSDKPLDLRREELSAWRRALAGALEGQLCGPMFPALVDTVARYGIPHEYLFDCIDGVEMDLAERTYESFAELEDYCYHVASVVGLSCIHIWGFSNPAAIAPARDLGVAFQLTNILRDLKEDAERGRIYLPGEDLRRFGYAADDLGRGVCNSQFRELMDFEIARAEEFYIRGTALLPYVSRDSRAALRAMTGIYRGLLGEIKRRGGDVFTKRVRLSGLRKASIAAWSLLPRTGNVGSAATARTQHG